MKEPIDRLNPQWEETNPGIGKWVGRGIGVVFHIVGGRDARSHYVSLQHAGEFLHVHYPFPSLSAAQRWCERYFG